MTPIPPPRAHRPDSILPEADREWLTRLIATESQRTAQALDALDRRLQALESTPTPAAANRTQTLLLTLLTLLITLAARALDIPTP